VLFCTPEKLACENFWQKLHNLHRRQRFAYLVVDECHLLIDQGYSFRQDYLKVGWLRTAFAQTRILCFSATCGAYATTSLTSLLSLRAVHMFEMDAVKRNVHFSVHYVSKKAKLCVCGLRNCTWTIQSSVTDKSIVKAAKMWGPGGALVLANGRSDVEKLCAFMQKALPDRTIEFYHGMLEDSARTMIQDNLLRGAIDILVATAASFGTGVNMPLVEQVIVVGMPMSIQTVVQIIGRGGRNGQQYRVDFFVKEGDMVKNNIMFVKENKDKSNCSRAHIQHYVQQKNNLEIVERVLYNTENKQDCQLNTVLHGANAVRQMLNVLFASLSQMKKMNMKVRRIDRAKWDSVLRTWYLAPLASNAGVSRTWGVSTTNLSHTHVDPCQKCRNCQRHCQAPPTVRDALNIP